MKVLIDHQIFARQRLGGISRYLINLANAFCQRDDLVVHLERGLAGGDAGSSGCTPRSGKDLAQPPGAARFLFEEALIRTGLRGHGDWDVHHATYYLSAHRRSRAYVVTHHDCTLERFPELFTAARFHMQLKARQYRRADRIIAISDHSASDLQEFYGVEPARITRVYHGVEAPGGGVCAPPLPSLEGRPYILFLGPRPPYKNFIRLLEAYAQSRVREECLLVVAGGGPFSPAEQERASSLGILDRLVSLPSVSDPTLNALFKDASLFVYPSLYEGFGFPPLEAMLADCPVVASGASSIPEVCQDAAIYFDPRSVESMAVTLESVFDSGAMEHLRTRGKAVASSYRWERCAEETARIYKSLI